MEMGIEESIENGYNRVQEDTRGPLIHHERDECCYGGVDGARKSSKEHLWMVYFSTFIAVCGSCEFGSSIGFSSPIQAAIRKDLHLPLTEYSLFASILTIGAITSGMIADFIGWKGAMRMSAIFCVIGWLAIYFGKGALPLDAGRLSLGYGVGIFSYVAPVFIAEIAPTNLRGGLTAISQLMFAIGLSGYLIIETVLTWRTLALVGLIPCLILLPGLFFIPESPIWLAKMSHHKEFYAALQRLRGKDADISNEAADIQDNIEALQKLPKAKTLDLYQRQYLRLVVITVGLMFFQQFGGLSGVCFYVSEIFVSAGFPSNAGTISYACIQITVAILGASLIDKAGRRPLLLVSASGLVLGCILVGISFYLKAHELATTGAPLLALIGLQVFIGSFSIGMGIIPSVIMSEIFPINVKGAGGSLATLVNWIGAWVVSYSFNFLMSWSSYGTFILFAITNALAILFIAKLVPETKGRTLEQIQSAINNVSEN
ncbi:sugar transporter ERD6-like 7 [Telopea speciosissima]|uniref:sugar transporter ERD6-like 7 n=1 Tax=Telopea speciosissima TaxID=54955 RepID=UPI001CC44D62|nr:sugar transporter ERD6-like 7 [Telopea speciosissima]